MRKIQILRAKTLTYILLTSLCFLKLQTLPLLNYTFTNTSQTPSPTPKAAEFKSMHLQPSYKTDKEERALGNPPILGIYHHSPTTHGLTTEAYLCTQNCLFIKDDDLANVLVPLDEILHGEDPNIAIIATYKNKSQNAEFLFTLCENLQTICDEYSVAGLAAKLALRGNPKIITTFSAAAGLEAEINYIASLLGAREATAKVDYLIIINKNTIDEKPILELLSKLRHSCNHTAGLLSLNNKIEEDTDLPVQDKDQIPFLLVNTEGGDFKDFYFLNRPIDSIAN